MLRLQMAGVQHLALYCVLLQSHGQPASISLQECHHITYQLSTMLLSPTASLTWTARVPMMLCACTRLGLPK